MSEQEHELDTFLRVLDEAGCLEHVILIGSWAEYMFAHANILPGFSPNIRTRDVDFLVRNLRRPQPAASLAAEARRRGYHVDSDRLTGVTKIFSPGGLEIEFLIAKMGAGLESALSTNVGVTAQSLRHLGILSRSSIAVEYHGMSISVPSPEAYVVQKMVINGERDQKAEKDVAAIGRLWPHLDPAELERQLSMLTRAEARRAESYMEKHGLSVDGC